MKINLGCGQKYLLGYVNCDILDSVRADKYFSLNLFPYPFPDSCAEEILLDNVLEHVDDVILVMHELHRISSNNCDIHIYVPYAKSDWAFQDITHKHFFTENSMDYFDKNFEYSFYSSKFNFELKEKKLISSTKTAKNKMRNLIPFRAILRYFLFNMYDGIYFHLLVKK